MVTPKLKTVGVAVAIACGLVAGPASAMLVLQQAAPVSGAGLGTFSTLLMLDSGEGTSEAGTVFWNGSASQISGAGPVGLTNSTYTFSQLGITDASQIGIVVNVDEPVGAAAINFGALSLLINSAAGTSIFSSGAFSCPGNVGCSLTNTLGTGNSGFLFALDSAQVAQANPFVIGTNRLGLSANASNATGGPETFYVVRLGGVVTPPVTPIPEPETYALMLAGLSLAGFAARRRKG